MCPVKMMWEVCEKRVRGVEIRVVLNGINGPDENDERQNCEGCLQHVDLE